MCWWWPSCHHQTEEQLAPSRLRGLTTAWHRCSTLNLTLPRGQRALTPLCTSDGPDVWMTSRGTWPAGARVRADGPAAPGLTATGDDAPAQFVDWPWRQETAETAPGQTSPPSASPRQDGWPARHTMAPLIHAGGEGAQRRLPRGGPRGCRPTTALGTVNQAVCLLSMMHRCLRDNWMRRSGELMASMRQTFMYRHSMTCRRSASPLWEQSPRCHRAEGCVPVTGQTDPKLHPPGH